MLSIAEKLVESTYKFEKVSQQIDILATKLGPANESKVFATFVDYILSSDNPISLRNIFLLEKVSLKLATPSEQQQQQTPQNPIPEPRISFRKDEFEVQILWMKCELRRHSQKKTASTTGTSQKQAESAVKSKLYKYLNTADQSAVWATQYLQAFFYTKEGHLQASFLPDNKRIAALNLFQFDYDENVQRIRFLFDFWQPNKHLFPLTIDFTEILIRWLMSLRGSSEDEMELGKRILQELNPPVVSTNPNANTMEFEDSSPINASDSKTIPVRAFTTCLYTLKFEYETSNKAIKPSTTAATSTITTNPTPPTNSTSSETTTAAPAVVIASATQNTPTPPAQKPTTTTTTTTTTANTSSSSQPLFDPRKMAQLLLTRLTPKQMKSLTQQSLAGLVFSNNICWYHLFRNLTFMATTDQITVLLLAIVEHMIMSKIFSPLSKILDTVILRVYLCLTQENTRGGALKVLRLFLLGSSPELKTFSKHSDLLHTYLTDIVCVPIASELFQLSQCFLRKYESSTNVDKFKRQLEEYYTPRSTQLHPLTVEEMDRVIASLNWMDYKSANMEVEHQTLSIDPQTASKSQIENPLIEAPNAKTLRGLQNLGNTCYMNSYVQALYMTKEFRYRVLKINLAEVMQSGKAEQNAQQPNKGSDLIEKQKKYVQVATVFQLQKLFALLFRSKRKYLNPKLFKSSLPDFFKLSFAQHDASEFGRIFLDQLEHSVKDTNDKKLLDDYFIGNYEHCMTCSNCNSKFKRAEKFLDISLNFNNELEEQKTIEENKKEQSATMTMEQEKKDMLDVSDLVSANFKPEVFDGDNKYECSVCASKQTATKDTVISHLPNYVILTLNRFQYDIKTFKKIKLLNPVQVLEEIDLSHHHVPTEQANNSDQSQTQDSMNQLEPALIPQNQRMVDESEESNTQELQSDSSNNNNINMLNNELIDPIINNNNNENQVYQLYAMVVHRGSTAESGHYFTYARDSCQADCKWMLFDDSHVTEEPSLEAILKSFSGTTSTPYLLFYQRKNHVLDYSCSFSETAFKISDRLVLSIEQDDRQMLQEIENQSNVFSLLNQIKINHQATQINSVFPTFSKPGSGGSGAGGAGGFMNNPFGGGGGGIC